MALLFSLRFFIGKTRGEKVVGRFYKLFILKCVFFSSLGGIITGIPVILRSGDLNQSNLLRRFLALGYCSIPMNQFGGELNDFNK